SVTKQFARPFGAVGYAKAPCGARVRSAARRVAQGAPRVASVAARGACRLSGALPDGAGDGSFNNYVAVRVEDLRADRRRGSGKEIVRDRDVAGRDVAGVAVEIEFDFSARRGRCCSHDLICSGDYTSRVRTGAQATTIDRSARAVRSLFAFEPELLAAGRNHHARACIDAADAGADVDAAASRALRRQAIFALTAAVVRLAAARVVVDRRDRRARIVGARRGRHDDAALSAAFLDRAVFAFGAAVVGHAADHVVVGCGRRRVARIRHAGLSGRNRSAFGETFVGRAIFAFGAVVVRNAADDLRVVRRIAAGGNVAGEDILSRRVADDQDRAARIEAEQKVARGARLAAEPRTDAAFVVGDELGDQ